jgi:signal transduction histidine kinase
MDFRLSSGSPPRDMVFSSTWLHRWIYYLAAGFMFAAAALRSFLIFQDTPLLGRVLLLLAAWMLAFIVDNLFADRSLWFSAVWIGLEMLIILILLRTTRADYFVFLFAIPIMQAMQQFTPKVTAALTGLATLLTFLTLLQPFGVFYALALAVLFFGGTVFLVVYIGSTRRARLIQDQQQALVSELQQANRRLEFYSQQQQQLAAGRERQRLARELHDSVTQTIFSMTMTTQSALLLLERDRQQVAAQLDRLDQLAQSTLAEMQVLISRLAPEAITGAGFVSTLQQHLADRRRLDNLSVTLEVKGNKLLEPAEEAGLFRIAQEALNNIVKHGLVSEAALRLHLAEPFWMEVADRGVGFDLLQAHGSGRVGLASMRERAAEIGWNLQVDSSPGKGTRIRVEKGPRGEKQA